MSITLVFNPNEDIVKAPHFYLGLSTDTKPTIASHDGLVEPSIGSEFRAHDTGILYITHNGTDWVEKDTIVRLEASASIDIGDVTLLAGTAEIGKLGAGSALIGKVGIDQTTPGTTNAVVEASAAAIKTAVELIDNFISGTKGLVTEDSGVAIKTAVELLDDAISGTEMQVDVVAALPAGTNAIGKLAANSGIDIGDVDVTSIATGTNAIGRVGHDTTGLGHGVTTVTTAGTDVVLAGSTACKWVTIQAQTDNTNKVAVGATGVDATVATGTGIILDPGDSITILTDNLADIYIDSLVNGEGVRYVYGT